MHGAQPKSTAPTQILHGRLHVTPARANAYLSDICKMLIKGIG
jgi:hypothetical protein